MIALLLAAVLQPREVAVSDRVDVVELSHVFDERGKLIFSQIVWWDWYDGEGCFHVRDWRMLKCDSQIPIRNHRTGRYNVTWDDCGVLRSVDADSFRETHTQGWDPEVADRKELPKSDRRKLSRMEK